MLECSANPVSGLQRRGTLLSGIRTMTWVGNILSLGIRNIVTEYLGAPNELRNKPCLAFTANNRPAYDLEKFMPLTRELRGPNQLGKVRRPYTGGLTYTLLRQIPLASGSTHRYNSAKS